MNSCNDEEAIVTDQNTRGQIKAPASTQATNSSATTNSQTIEQPHLVTVAVIGDVTTDWTFLSREPAPARIPDVKPWNGDKSTHLFAMPSGAWMLGHMLQGALWEPPIFEREHSVRITPLGTGTPTRILLKGDLDIPKESLDIELSFSNPGAFRLLINDAHPLPGSPALFPPRGPLKLTLRRPKDPTQRTKLVMNITKGRLLFHSEDNPTPGFLNANQVYRSYDAENIIVPHDSYQCAMLEVRHCSIQFDGGGTIDGTITILPWATWESLDHSTYIKLTVLSSRPVSKITMKRATVDMIYGTLRATTTTTDHGKLNPPSPYELRSTDKEAMKPSVNLRCVFPSQHIRYFMYENPRNMLTRPERSHIVYALSELRHFNRFHGQKTELQVYRRSEYHGTAGPEVGYPAILDNYYPVSGGSFADVTARDSLSHVVHTYPYARPGIKSPPTMEPIELGQVWDASHLKTSVIVIDDEGLGFGSRPDLWKPFLSSIEQLPKDAPRPWIIIKASQWLDCRDSQLLKFLYDNDAMAKTIVIISGESLRKGLTGRNEKPGIKLSKTVSWEKTVEDFAHAWTMQELGLLGKCGNVLVRLGMEGAIAASIFVPPRLYFDARRIEGEYAPVAQFGELPGLSTVFTCAIASRLICRLANEPQEVEANAVPEIRSFIKYGLNCIRRYFDLGYGPTHETIAKYAELMLPVSQIFRTGRITHLAEDGIHRFLECDVPVDRASRRKDTWSILNQTLLSGVAYRGSGAVAGTAVEAPSDDEPWKSAAEARKLARLIVVRGVKRAFSGEKWAFPYAKFGRLVSIDRGEIEGLRSVRNLLAEYNRFKERQKPVSLAVFGPPGSGKSFGVREIANGVMDEKVVEHVFNMSQFAAFADVTKLLLKVREDSLENRMPLVFFDEFDSPFDGKPLGWLKYFLAPMQDGRFQHENDMLGIGRAIFVFAGGIAPTHEKFNEIETWELGEEGRHDLNPLVEQSKRKGRTAYVTAKGPDFHSRLRGFLDIKGINPLLLEPPSRDKPTADKAKFDKFAGEDFSFIVRRAVLVRQMIEDPERTGRGGILDVEGNAEIDRDILDALLLCDVFKHGVRSLQAVFEMSAIYKERAFTKTALPSNEQLMMHVDDTFYSILRRRYEDIGSKIIAKVLMDNELLGNGADEEE